MPFGRRTWLRPIALARRGAGPLLACLVAFAVHAVEKLPIQGDATRDRFNRHSAAGLPLSAVSGTPAGSNGRAPAAGTENGSGSFNDATPGQFQTWHCLLYTSDAADE